MKSFLNVPEISIPDDIPASLRSTEAAWERFISTGEFFAEDEPREVIAKGWQRCKTLGIDPYEERARSVISYEEVDARLHTENLGLSGKVVLDRMAQTVEDTGHVIVLADKAGRILYSVGHEKVRDQLESINFRPGGDWSEEFVGLNGIGTPLALGKPEIILGSEHYCEGWKPWVCYGAPIHNPSDHSIIGCIDITGPVGKAQAEAMALSVSIAHSIEFYLSTVLLRRRESLRGTYTTLEKRFPNDALLVLDETGNIIVANNASLKLLELSTPSLMNDAFKQLYPELSMKVSECLQTSKESECRVNLYNSITGSARCAIKPIGDKGDRLGIAILFPSGKTVNKPDDVAQSPVQKPKSNSAKYTFDNLIGESARLKKTLDIARMAALDTMQNSVLLIGETGTGKELIAHAIHAEGIMKQGPFVPVNCGALPKDLVESELFGYTQGAFTGAKKEGQIGKFEAANSGTLFLDEIDSLSLDLQAKLLRVLDEKAITRLGSIAPIQLNVRIIAAASSDLSLAIEANKFRRDLFHRLNVIEIHVPPIRDRGNDILSLLDYFIEDECKRAERETLIISEDVKDKLLSYNWPGNIRELRNLSARWVLTVEGREVTLADIPERIQRINNDSVMGDNNVSTIRSVEDELIRKTLAETNGNISKTAKILGINRSTIYRRNNRYKNN